MLAKATAAKSSWKAPIGLPSTRSRRSSATTRFSLYSCLNTGACGGACPAAVVMRAESLVQKMQAHKNSRDRTRIRMLDVSYTLGGGWEVQA